MRREGPEAVKVGAPETPYQTARRRVPCKEYLSIRTRRQLCLFPARDRGGGPMSAFHVRREADEQLCWAPRSTGPTTLSPDPIGHRWVDLEAELDRRRSHLSTVARQPGCARTHRHLPTTREVRRRDSWPQRRVLVLGGARLHPELLRPPADPHRRRAAIAADQRLPTAARQYDFLTSRSSRRRIAIPSYSPCASNLLPRAERRHARGNFGERSRVPTCASSTSRDRSNA